MNIVIKYSIGVCVVVVMLCLSLTACGYRPSSEKAVTALPKKEVDVSKEDSVTSKAELTNEVDSDSTKEVSSKEISVGELKSDTEPTLPKEMILDVPLLNQMDAPRLYNGCEVTSLAMMLNFSGIKVTKNELAAKITRVPLKYGDGTNGNPNVGFVGNMEDGPGLGVYHKPIFQLAQNYVKNGVVDLTKQPFSAIIEKVAQGKPVWVITTTTFSPTTQIKSWSTPQGPVAVSYKMHSVVITGFDQDNIYINDPYGTKNKKLNKENFIKAWEQMGSQAVVITGA